MQTLTIPTPARDVYDLAERLAHAAGVGTLSLPAAQAPRLREPARFEILLGDGRVGVSGRGQVTSYIEAEGGRVFLSDLEFEGPGALLFRLMLQPNMDRESTPPSSMGENETVRLDSEPPPRL